MANEQSSRSDVVRMNVAQGLEDLRTYGGNVLHSDRQNLLGKAIELLRAPVSERGTLERIAEMMVKGGVDFNICAPGNHGGDADKWLVTVETGYGDKFTEYFGATLAEAVEASLCERPDVTKGGSNV